MPTMMTVKEVAAELRVNQVTVLAAIKRKHLRAINLTNGKKRPTWRITPEALNDYLAFRGSEVDRNEPQPRRKKLVLPSGMKRRFSKGQ